MNCQLVLLEIVFIGLYLLYISDDNTNNNNNNNNNKIIVIIIMKCIFIQSLFALSVAKYLAVGCTGSTLGLEKGSD